MENNEDHLSLRTMDADDRSLHILVINLAKEGNAVSRSPFSGKPFPVIQRNVGGSPWPGRCGPFGRRWESRGWRPWMDASWPTKCMGERGLLSAFRVSLFHDQDPVGFGSMLTPQTLFYLVQGGGLGIPPALPGGIAGDSVTPCA